jgi:nitrite reductase/ring-hydroxylating ferredoxin subunit
MNRPLHFLFAVLFVALAVVVDSFSFVLMGARRGKGDLQQNINDQYKNKNKKQDQEITGVTLPAEGKIKGWEFGQGKTLACANVGGTFFAIQGNCPRCAFDLWKGELIVDEIAWGKDVPRIACPTCSTTYGMRSGLLGPPLKRTGLQGFVGNLAKTATAKDSYKNAKAFLITRDNDGRVYCRER